ncbi:DUF47 domain-containing protein [Candidatus Sumerlaeota bacterium]|nr:DUF47 domain-containing protein [Candidatus Sumerlaeota bacterium]
MRLFPKSVDFFPYFDTMAHCIFEGAELLHQMVKLEDQAPELARRIKGLEHKADGVTHDTMRKLDATFITPFDREDIHLLVSRLDDVIDNIDVAASRMILYEIKTPSKQLEGLTGILLKAATCIISAVTKFRDPKHTKQTMSDLIEINRIEEEGDQAHRAALVHLFKNVKDPIEVIKLKDTYESVENAIDRCEDVANVLEAVIVKNA